MTKKRPSKTAKAAQKAVAESKLLATKNATGTDAGAEFRAAQVTPRTNTTAMKPRPNKKRG